MTIKNLAIVGLGSIGKRHFRVARKISPNTKITLVRSGKGMPFPEEKKADYIVSSIKKAIALGAESAIISSPANLHIEQSLQFSEANIPLLIEKPLSHNLDLTSQLVEKSKETNNTVLVGYVMRYDPAAQFFKKFLLNEKIGKILHAKIECGSYLPDWRPGQDYKETVSALPNMGGGVFLELSHEIDYMRWFFSEPQTIQANIRNSKTLEVNVEDQVDLIITSKEGYPISIQLDFNRRIPKRKCCVQTTKGELIWNALDKKVIWQEPHKEANVTSFNFKRDYLFEEQLKHFFTCIEIKKNPKVTLVDGINVLKIIEAAKQSNREGRKIIL